MKPLLYGLFFLGLPTWPFEAVSQIYHVATTGSDEAGTGAEANPWATISHAIRQVNDGSLILVRPGVYFGRVDLRGEFESAVTIRSEAAYQALLRHDQTVVACYYGKGIVLEGFDIAHSGPGAGALVIQIQDLIGAPGGEDAVSRIVLRNNILHDSYNNDLLKINNGAREVLVEGNLFYNQSGHDEHIDVNSVTDVRIQDNIFFNSFEGGGRVNGNDTGSFIVVKDSNGMDDDVLGSDRITIRRNIFLNWQGSTGSNFILFGEDGRDYHEAMNGLVENNLLIGNSPHVMRAAFGVKGCRDILFRNNTVTGDLPSLAYAARLNLEGENLPNENIRFQNNIWSDPTGTMGAENPSRPNDFSDAPLGETLSFELDNNLYWNGGAVIPEDASELVNPTDDVNGVVADPLLPSVDGISLPVFSPLLGRFGDGSLVIRGAFEKLVENYGTPGEGSAAIDAASGENSSGEDILQRPRPVGQASDIGAVEVPEAGGPHGAQSHWMLF